MEILLTVLAAILFAFGWIAGKIALAVQWIWHALRVGFVDARKPRKKKLGAGSGEA
jgi:uncharacterized membrane protein YciS (DUF1049 family)